MTVGDIRRRLNADRVRRLGAALWFRCGFRLQLQDLDWAVPLLGEGGDCLLWQELQAAGILDAENRIRPRALARWLVRLTEDSLDTTPQLVWTLPDAHPASRELGSTYRLAVLDTVEAAQRELVITSPFLQQSGVIEVLSAVVGALKRGVRLIILTHKVSDLASGQSVALETIRREAERIGGHLTVYSVPIGGGDLLHAKLVIADSKRMVLGSANLTGPALTTNFEAGVVLGSEEALIARRIVQGLIDASIAVKVFSTRN